MTKGYDVGYLTKEVGAGRERYYSSAVVAGEPPGRWYGAGAELLGLSGEVDPEQLEVVYHHLLDPRDPASRRRATWGEAAQLGRPHKNYKSAEEIYRVAVEREPSAGPERRAELRAEAERSERQPVAFLDLTFNAPKSLSVLLIAFERAAAEARAAGDHDEAAWWDTHVQAVEDAAMAGARAAIDFLQDKAGYARVGHHGGGAGRWIDAHEWVTAQYLQHDSRDRDPHLHVHNPTLNRARGADGQWRALDTRAIHTWRAAAGALADRTAEATAYEAIGARWETRPDGKAREVVGVDTEVMDGFSSRTHAIGPETQRLVTEYRNKHGHEPSPLIRTRLEKHATLATRRAKSHDGETTQQRLARWEARAQQIVDDGLAGIAHRAVDAAQQGDPPQTWSERDVLDRAAAALRDRGSSSESEVMKAVADALPGHLGIAPHEVRTLVESLARKLLAEAERLGPAEDTTNLPADYLRADGRSVFANPTGPRWALPGQISDEHQLRAAAVRRGAATLTAEQASAALTRLAEHGREPGADQAAAIRGVLCSGAFVECLSAPAGTGKTVTVGAVADTWAEHGRRVIGLAPSQAAADVLTEEGLPASNIAAWLTTQQQLDHTTPGAAARWRLGSGDLVVVDEAGMAATGDLAAIQRRCEQAEAKLLLVGDPRQLAAVGAGGAFADLTTKAARYELAEVRRFHHGWERTASLGLRDGDPAALDAYQRHGRLLDGGTAEEAERAAARAWLADTLAGRESLLVVGSNVAAARVSMELRAELVALGRVEETGVALGRDGTIAGVGDLVQARRNGWELRGWEANTRAPINRGTYRVTGLRADGGLTVAPVYGRGPDGVEQLGQPLQLPATYVAADLSLGYASTVHAAQGCTVDTAHAVLTANTSSASTYVAMTRGRHTNTAHLVTRAVPDDAPTGQTHQVAQRTPLTVMADAIEPDPAEDSRTALAEREQAEHDARSVMTHVDQLSGRVEQLIAGRTGATLDRLAADGALSDLARQRLAADDAHGALEQLLRAAELAGHDPHQVLRAAVTGRELDSARSPAQVVHARIRAQLAGQLAPCIASYANLIPATGIPVVDRLWLTARAEAADTRRRELGAETADRAPQWAREALGPVPADPVARAEWEHAAGWAAAHREHVGHTDQADPLGPQPGAGLTDKHALWQHAHTALALPDGGGDEHDLTDGQLRGRVRAMEREERWAPRYVGDQLDTTIQQADRAREDAQLWSARADATADPAEAEQLRAAAATAAAEAADLDQRAERLDFADQARAAWYANTAVTRNAADRARGALQARGIDPDDPDDQVTADEWLAAHRAEQTAEDPHREIRDDVDLTATRADAAAEPTAAPAPVQRVDHPELSNARHHVQEPDMAPTPEIAVPDIRDTTEPDPGEHAAPADRYWAPAADETAAAVARAQAALAEIDARRSADARRETDDAHDTTRREELARWAEHDASAEVSVSTPDDRGDTEQRVLEC